MVSSSHHLKVGRDVSLFTICVLWLIVGSFPPDIDPDSKFILNGIERQTGQFIYDLYNKIGCLLGFLICFIKDRTGWIRIIIFPVFADCSYELLDLIVTDDIAHEKYALIIQNITVGGSFLWGAWQEYKQGTINESYQHSDLK